MPFCESTLVPLGSQEDKWRCISCLGSFNRVSSRNASLCTKKLPPFEKKDRIITYSSLLSSTKGAREGNTNNCLISGPLFEETCNVWSGKIANLYCAIFFSPQEPKRHFWALKIAPSDKREGLRHGVQFPLRENARKKNRAI